jgi:hypothetical protein
MEKVELTQREQLIEVVQARLDHHFDLAIEDVTTGILASLIVDDILQGIPLRALAGNES